MNQTVSSTQVEAEIRAFLKSWEKDVQSRDVKKIMSHYADDVVAFDAIGSLRFKGAKAYGAHWEKCMTMCPGPMIFEVHELQITASDDVAFGHFLTHCGGTDQNGEQHASWMRATSCLRRENGQWSIAHEHFSAPFEMESGKAQFDLQP